VDKSIGQMFGLSVFENSGVHIQDPVCEDPFWKNAASSAYAFGTLQTKLLGLFDEMKRLEKDYLHQELPTSTSDLFRRLFEQV
jgi:hypothetical protein